MYRKRSNNWTKHLDFLILDLISLQLALLVSYIIRMGWQDIYDNIIYQKMAVILVMIDIFVIFFSESFKDILKRGYYKEFTAMGAQALLVALCSAFYLFAVQEGQAYSRSILIMTGVTYFLFGYLARIGWKGFLKRNKGRDSNRRALLVVTTKDRAKASLNGLKRLALTDYRIIGLALADADLTGKKLAGCPVVASEGSLIEYVCRKWVDEVLIDLPEKDSFPEKLENALLEAGVAIHYKMADMTEGAAEKRTVENLGDYTVLTVSANMMSSKQAVVKRFMDICGGLAGCLITGILFIFVAPAIYRKSPGPIFFSQERMGKNGRVFKIYKFRSMYLDAEERKKELMEKNRVKDGRMFKLDYDPRIIGSEAGPDKGIGNFIRKYSIDEFPQFFNVLKGDMSLVGTRPPTVDEWETYELHHRARMATKPGLTGMWQVSGRSEITDFEEVVRLDTYYIEHWSLGLDIKILLKTVGVVFGKKGSM